MAAFTPDGRKLVDDIAARHGVSVGAVETLLMALAAGHGTQAQFNHPDLGGMGQWSAGGMTMVGDMFNNALKAQVDAICSELSAAMAGGELFAQRPQAPASSQSQSQGDGTSLFVSGSGFGQPDWPEELGHAASAGAQNDMQYAVFPGTRRLAIRVGDRMEVYDTGDHLISGVSQQQSGDRTLTFTSQFGTVRLSDLKRVSVGDAARDPEPEPPSAPAQTPANVSPVAEPEPTEQPVPPPSPATEAQEAGVDGGQIIALIRQLADLRAAGILTDAEFEAKKAELLARL